jgi:uncharacterized protein (TIGR02453 family)
MENVRITTLNFLRALKDNNNRNWFNENRTTFENAKENFENIIQKFLDEISVIEPIMKGLEPKSCIYRINRDIRFSKDKSPYKTHFGAFIVRGGRKNGDRFAGYYIHIEPDNSIIAGGAYMPPTPWLSAIREKIHNDGELFTKIINNKEFVKYFGKIEGDKLKTAPKGYPSDHPYIDLLKYKSYLVVKEFSDKEVLSPDYLSNSMKIIRLIKPFNDFLNNN